MQQIVSATRFGTEARATKGVVMDPVVDEMVMRHLHLVTAEFF